MASATWTTPASILTGFAMVAVATYFGLRDRRPAPVGGGAASVVVAPVKGSDPPKDPVSMATGMTSPQVANAGLRDSSAEATEIFQQSRAGLVAACPPSNLSAKPGAYEMNLIFDADGKEVARGLNELHDVRPEVTACIRQHRTPIQIAASGARSRARVAFTIP